MVESINVKGKSKKIRERQKIYQFTIVRKVAKRKLLAFVLETTIGRPYLWLLIYA